MIKNDDLIALKRRAEQSGEAHDWATYAEALEDRIETPHAALLYEGGDSEVTRESVPAHREAIEAIVGLDDSSHRFLTIPVQLLMDRRTEFIYAIEVRGQSSVTAHGKQGLRPLRGAVLERLNETGVPVLFAIKDGKKWRLGWMSELGPSKSISRGAAGAEETARAGWPVSAFRTEETLVFPSTYNPRQLAQAKLG